MERVPSATTTIIIIPIYPSLVDPLRSFSHRSLVNCTVSLEELVMGRLGVLPAGSPFCRVTPTPWCSPQCCSEWPWVILTTENPFCLLLGRPHHWSSQWLSEARRPFCLHRHPHASRRFLRLALTFTAVCTATTTATAAGSLSRAG